MRSPQFTLMFAALSLAAACAPATAPVTPAALEAPPSGSAAEPARSHDGGASTATPAAGPSALVVGAVPPPVAPSSPGATQAPPPAFQETLDGARKAIAPATSSTADKPLEAAAAMAGETSTSRILVAHVRATRYAYAGDLERAAAALVAVIPAREASRAAGRVLVAQRDDDDPRGAGRSGRGARRERQATLSPRAAFGTRGSRDARLPEGPLAPRLPHADARRVAHWLGEGGARPVRARCPRRVPRRAEASPTRSPCSKRTSPRSMASARRRSPPPSESIRPRTTTSKTCTSSSWASRQEGIMPRPRRCGARCAGLEARNVARAIMLRWLDLDAKAPRAHGFTPWHATAR